MNAPRSALYAYAFCAVVLVMAGLTSCKGHRRPQVVLYCSVDQDIAEPIIAQFEKDTGIQVLARFDTEASKTAGLVQRLRAEKARPAADVFWSGEVFYTARLASEGVFVQYRSARTADWPRAYADPNGRWYGFGLRARALVYNTQRVRPDQSPRSLEDVLDPRWRGRLVMARPQFGTTGGDIASWLAHYGRDRTLGILRGLRGNQVRLVAGNSNVVRVVAQGQADVGLTDTDDVYAGQRNGWPVARNLLDQAGEGALAIPNTVAMIQAGPHPSQARVLMEFLLHEQVERLLAASDSHNCPVRPQVAEAFKEYAIERSLNIPYDRIAACVPEALHMAEEILD